ncbi:MAG: GTP-binding protein [Micrococcales bacterium]|nr:GTP-binding protein [Micrococcales bacterium]MCL2668765.1 GTP-binding protein [Micrococcales bacterium]
MTVGTIGHVGHGKTVLTAAMTKLLHDRHSELNVFVPVDALEPDGHGVAAVEYQTENRYYEHLDSPGRFFVRNMIAFLDLDIAILVVAASDGVVSETVEHMGLARQVGVPSLVVALTKADGQSAERLDAAEREVRAALTEQGFPGDEAQVIRVSGLMALQSDPEWTRSVENLLDALDNVPELPRELDQPFLMAVEDVIPVADRGAMVTGWVERGRVEVGAEIEVVGFRDEPLTTTVAAIEAYRTTIDSLQAGDVAGLWLATHDVTHGQILAAPGSVTASTEFEGLVYILTEEEGGRPIPVFSDQPMQFYVRTAGVAGVVTLPDGTDKVVPGTSATIRVTLTLPLPLEEGLRFAVRDDDCTVGVGRVGVLHASDR